MARIKGLVARRIAATPRFAAILLAALLVSVGCGSDPAAGEGDASSSGGGADGTVSTEDGGTLEDGADTGSATPDTGDSPDESSSADSGDDSSTAGDTGADTGADPDSASSDAADASGPLPGEPYAPCNSNTDCDKGICIPGVGGATICAQTCTDSCDKSGYVCKLVVPPGGSDATSICVAEGGNICNPCDKNAQCISFAYPKAACVDTGDGGAFCGTGCQSDDGCVVGYQCKDGKDVDGNAVKQCVPKDSGVCTCSEEAKTKKLQTKCFKQTGTAKCEGVRKCLPKGEQGAPPEGGLSACLADSGGVETCDGKDNDCDGDTDEETCNDNETCTVDSCDAKTAQCKHENQGGPCDADDSLCTENDECSNGLCKAGAALTCDDKNDCTNDTCDPKKGCEYKVAEGKACDYDNNLCTANDACDKDGACAKGKQLSCSDDNPCLVGVCKVTTGKCAYSDNDGQLCDDGNPCSIKDKCAGELCKGAPNLCDDDNSCTDDACNQTKGCIHTAQNGQCDDGDQCTVKDQCDGDKCIGTGKKDCSDGKECTNDGCDSKKGCINEPATNVKCEDGNGCTVGDNCENGTCKAGANKCTCFTDDDCKKEEDGNACNGTLFCDKTKSPFECAVDIKTIVDCSAIAKDDGQCKKTTCVSATGKCVTESATLNGKDCTDESLCTKGDICKDGACATEKVECDDKNPCTDDACDAKKGCTKTNNTAPCDADGDKCTADDTCSAGACDAGQAKSCDDSNQCTTDTCDKATGACKHEQASGKCDDGNPCTEGDTCGTLDTKWQCVPGNGPDCDDKNPCTTDTCEKGTGCKSVVDATLKVPCYSADPKTMDVGVCKAGYKTCDKDGNQGATCIDEKVPAANELCEGSDDDCDGTTDEGCKPTGYHARFGNALIEGKGTKMSARVFVGGSTTAGPAAGTGKFSARFGFYEWLAAALGSK